MSLIVVEKNLDMNILFDTNLQQRPYIFFLYKSFLSCAYVEPIHEIN